MLNSPFGSLSAELRCMIYNDALPSPSERNTFGDEPALLHVCSLMRQESRPIYTKRVNSVRLSIHILERNGSTSLYAAVRDRNVRQCELPDSILSKLRTIDFVITFDQRFFSRDDVAKNLPAAYTLIKSIEVSAHADGRCQVAITHKNTFTKVFLQPEKDFRKSTKMGIWFAVRAALCMVDWSKIDSSRLRVTGSYMAYTVDRNIFDIMHECAPALQQLYNRSSIGGISMTNLLGRMASKTTELQRARQVSISEEVKVVLQIRGLMQMYNHSPDVAGFWSGLQKMGQEQAELRQAWLQR